MDFGDDLRARDRLIRETVHAIVAVLARREVPVGGVTIRDLVEAVDSWFRAASTAGLQGGVSTDAHRQRLASTVDEVLKRHAVNLDTEAREAIRGALDRWVAD